MNKVYGVSNLYLCVTALLLFSFLITGCSVRYDDSKRTYTLGKNTEASSSRTPQRGETYRAGQHDGATAHYSEGKNNKAKTYRSSRPGPTYRIGQHDNATAHYTLRQGDSSKRQPVARPAADTYDLPDTTVTDMPLVIEVSDILFEFDKWVIKKPFVPELERWAEYFLNNPDVTAEIYGHADSTGPTVYNQSLSEKRAQAVIHYLVDKGVTPGRLTAKGFGETQPVVPNTTQEGRQKNRRVELHF